MNTFTVSSVKPDSFLISFLVMVDFQSYEGRGMRLYTVCV